ncbi:MAG: hypothetical protein ACFFCW_20250 [Candidatus Hodarchaeota archaeon]
MGKPFRDTIELPAAVYRKIIHHSLIGLRETTENRTYRYDRWKEVIGTLLGKFKAGKIKIFEYLKRDIIVGKDILRPATRMIGFTWFLLFAQKLV